MTIVENPTTSIIGGVDTHLDVPIAAAIDADGGTMGTETLGVGAGHYDQLCRWLASFGPISKVGVEGTGSYGSGLARQILNQMRHICFCALDDIRARFTGTSPNALISQTAAVRPRNDGDVVRYTTLMTLRELGRRARNLREENKRARPAAAAADSPDGTELARGQRRRLRHRRQAVRRRR